MGALLRPCRWVAVSELAELQRAHDPARALAQERDRDGAVVRICQAKQSRIDRLYALDLSRRPP